MSTDQELFALARRVGRCLHASGRRVTTAESCTAGWVAKAITDVAGSSAWFESGFVVYSNAAKVRDLGVSPRVLQRHGAVSEQTVRQMARGALRVAGADVAIAISGIAGPDGGTPDKPVGTVWFGLAVRIGRRVSVTAQRKRFDGDREAVRRKSVEQALRLVLKAETRPEAGISRPARSTGPRSEPRSHRRRSSVPRARTPNRRRTRSAV